MGEKEGVIDFALFVCVCVVNATSNNNKNNEQKRKGKHNNNQCGVFFMGRERRSSILE